MFAFMGNLSSKTRKCHISLTIYCRTHASHVSSVVNDLWSQILIRSSKNAKAYGGCEWGRYENNCKFLPTGDDSDTVFLCLSYRLRPTAKLEAGRITQDLINRGPLEMLTIAKLIKIKVLMHLFSNLMFNFHDMCLLNKIYKYVS